jgi:hypothetical protein
MTEYTHAPTTDGWLTATLDRNKGPLNCVTRIQARFIAKGF